MRRVMVFVLGGIVLAGAPGSVAGASVEKVEYPRQVVAVTTGGRVLVLDAVDGRVVRTLSARASPDGGLAVRDGTVWFLSRGERSVTTCGHGAPPGQHVMAVPLVGGTPQQVLDAPVRWFDVSPDGRTLAVTAGRCPPAGTITTYDVATGSLVGRWTGAPPDGTSGDISSLTWSPDSRSLLYVREVGSTYPWILDTTTATSLDEAHRVFIGDGSRVSAYLGSTGSLVGVSVTAGGTSRAWAFDASTGARLRPLFCCGWPLAADTAGTSVLASTGASALVRWSAGVATPTRLARHVTEAVWVERARQ